MKGVKDVKVHAAASCVFWLACVFTSSTPFTSFTRAHERITTTITWDREISAIVRARCVTCHRDGGRAPMSLTTYAEARPWARAIKHEVLARRMPVWHAARGYGDFANDPSLSPFEIALIVAWVDGGAPRSFVPRGGVAPRLPGPPEAPLIPEEPEPLIRRPTREVVLPCRDQAAPVGTLAGLRPSLQKGASVRVVASLATGSSEMLGWFRDFDPKFATTYWLRAPITLPAGARISVTQEPADGSCRLVLLIAQ